MMQLEQHSAADFANAIRALMPPGEVWDWGQGGLGDALLSGPAQELARADAEVNPLLDAAVQVHKPKVLSWRLTDYRAVADASQAGVSELVPRAAFAAGSAAGSRLWSNAGASFSVPTTVVDVCRPFVAGSPAGTRLWGERARYALLVSYYATVADLAALREALATFKQSHVVLFFIDITQSGGEFIDA
jgi:hypothetical protein